MLLIYSVFEYLPLMSDVYHSSVLLSSKCSEYCNIGDDMIQGHTESCDACTEA